MAQSMGFVSLNPSYVRHFARSAPMTTDEAIHQSTRTVRVGDAAIHVTEWGAGAPVLLLHGNPDSGIMWEGIAKRLARHHRCIAPDLPGFGHSEVPTHFQPSLDGMAQFLEQFLEAAAVERPVDLVAHDFGGPFAFAWAARHPDAVRRMVVINTLFFSDYRWHFWARVWRTPILGELSMLAVNRPMFARELRRGSKAISDDHIDRTIALMTPRMKKEVLRLYRAADPANFKPWEEGLLALIRAKPTLVIWGDKDPYVSSRFAERFNARKVVHLAHTGHWAPVEAPAECADAMLQFFSETA
jgi:pimeloyl-ACP methyl ester carboxylesterase